MTEITQLLSDQALKIATILELKMDSNIKCVVCKGGTISCIDEVSGQHLSALYKKFGVYDLTLPDVITVYQCKECLVKWFFPVQTGDSAFYECLQQHDWYYQDEKPEFTFAAKALTNSKSVLEIGCGTGHFVGRLQSDVRYVGLDFNDSAIREGLKKNLDVRNQSIADFSANCDMQINAVVAFQVLEHVPDPSAFLHECAALLKKGGLFVISVPNDDAFQGVATNHTMNLPPHHVTRWERKTFEVWAENNGFIIDDLFFDPIAPYHLVWWRSAILQEKLRSVFNMPFKYVDISLYWSLLAKACAILARFLRIEGSGDKGHSITVVMKKA